MLTFDDEEGLEQDVDRLEGFNKRQLDNKILINKLDEFKEQYIKKHYNLSKAEILYRFSALYDFVKYIENN